MTTKAMITIWPDNETKINTIRGDLLKKNKKLKQSTLINLVLQLYFEEHPEAIKNPEMFLQEDDEDDV